MNTPKSLESKAAWELVQHDPRAILIDVRSSMEYLFVGHPAGAINIPWIDEPNWEINPDFALEIRKLLLGGKIEHGKIHSAPILLICRSGNRSAEAGAVLIENGFENVFNIAHGFEGELDGKHHRSTRGGWRFDSLPWEQC